MSKKDLSRKKELLRELAIIELKTKRMKTIKKQMCSIFTSGERKACIDAFDENFIKGFIDSSLANLSRK
jgi:hypothetical protein